MNDAAINLEPTFNLPTLNLPELSDSFLTDPKAAFSDGEKFVVFFLDDTLFAFPAREVTEVIRPLRYTPLPSAPSWLHGIAHLRGEIISIVNLAEFCHKTPVAISTKSKFVVIKPKNYDSPVAFPIDKLSEIITLTIDEINVGEIPFFLGEAVYKSAPVYLLDTDQIFSSLLIGS